LRNIVRSEREEFELVPGVNHEQTGLEEGDRNWFLAFREEAVCQMGVPSQFWLRVVG
jgi:hypothetical protein